MTLRVFERCATSMKRNKIKLSATVEETVTFYYSFVRIVNVAESSQQKGRVMIFTIHMITTATIGVASKNGGLNLRKFNVITVSYHDS